MIQCYIELRKGAARGSDSLAADVMRHLHSRQHLGKAVIICEQPATLLATARKQWLKLSRSLQKQRATTLNADKILKFTHAITRMQHMGFSAKAPLDSPEADVYFLAPGQLELLPAQCWTVYVLTPISQELAQGLLTQLPFGALIVDYLEAPFWSRERRVAPKKELEQRVEAQWRQATALLHQFHIRIEDLTDNTHQAVVAMDDALDTLLGNAHTFLEAASAFQRALEIARPLRLNKEKRSVYDAYILLAHRVQALSPGAFGHHFLQAYNEDDTFFLYDAQRGYIVAGEPLAEAYQRQLRAGRKRLAAALYQLGTKPTRLPFHEII